MKHFFWVNFTEFASVLFLICLPSFTATATPVQYHYNGLNNGVNATETTLTPANVNSNSFGKIFQVTVDGSVFAQPLYVPSVKISAGKNAGTHNAVFVATENASVFAFDANNGKLLWYTSLLLGPPGTENPVPASDTPSQVGATFGVTSTPVIDPVAGLLYVIAFTMKPVGEVNHYIYRISALRLSDGTNMMNSVISDTVFTGEELTDDNGVPTSEYYDPTKFQYVTAPSVPGTGAGSVNGTVSLNSLWQIQRSALTLVNGNVYASFAGTQEPGTYHGWLLSFNASNLQLNGTFNSTPNGSEGGMWSAGGPVVTDSNGFLYVATGNGTFDTNLTVSGFPSSGDYGGSIVKLSPQLKVVDYFTPSDQQYLSDNDFDLGSGDVTILPDSLGSTKYPHLLVADGKEGTIYLLNRDHLGGFAASPGVDNVVQEIVTATQGLWSSMGLFNNILFIGGAQEGSSDYARTFNFLPGQAKLSTTTSVTQSPDIFSWPGPTPSISANGTQNGIVWATGFPDQIRAYDASQGFAKEIWTTGQNSARDDYPGATKFSVPMVANGMVYAAGQNVLTAYGLLPRKNTPSDFIASIYNSVLNRPADQGGYNAYYDWMASGASRGAVAASFLSSQEYRQDFVTNAYVHYLHRQPDPFGLKSYVYYLSNGWTDEQFLASIVSSQEYQNLHAYNTTNASPWVIALYQDILGRTPNAQEVAGKVAYVKATGSLSQCALTFLTSVELHNDLVSSYYTTYLQRPADPSGFSSYVGLMNQGWSREQVLGSMLSSPEYLVTSQQ